MDGIKATRVIRRFNSRTRILLVCPGNDDHTLAAAASGDSAFLNIRGGLEQLVPTIRSLVRPPPA